MFSSLSFLYVSVVFTLFGVDTFAETFPPSKVVWSAQQAYGYCKGSVFGWYPYETPNVCREGPLVVSPGSSTLLILCYDNVAIGLTRTPGNSSSIEPLGLIPRTGNLTLKITDPQVNITFESRCENPAPAETIAQKNSWKLPNNANPARSLFGPCCALEFNVPTNYIGDLYYQSSLTDFFSGQLIIAANVTSTTTTPTPPNNTTTSNTTTDSGTTTVSTTTTSTTTTTPPVPTSTPLPPNATTAVPTATPTVNPTPTPTITISTTSPPTTINSTNSAANSASDSLAAYSCTVLTMLIVVLPSYFSVL